MIIEQDKPDFKPIVITLQDAAEAKAFWIMLHEAENHFRRISATDGCQSF